MSIPDPSEQQEEIDSEVSIKPEKDFPAVHSLEHAEIVCDTEDYRILDVAFENTLGWTLWTTVWVTLKPGRFTFHFANKHVNMKYSVTQGNIWALVGTTGHILQAGDMLTVPRGAGHMLLNRWDSPALYTIDVPARMDLRKYLGTSMPFSRAVDALKATGPVPGQVTTTRKPPVSEVIYETDPAERLSREFDLDQPMSAGST